MKVLLTSSVSAKSLLNKNASKETSTLDISLDIGGASLAFHDLAMTQRIILHMTTNRPTEVPLVFKGRTGAIILKQKGSRIKMIIGLSGIELCFRHFHSIILCEILDRDRIR